MAQRSAWVVVLLCVVVTSAVGARQAPQAPAFRSGVDLIAVDAEVFDKNGKPIEGLTPDKFEVNVGGRPRRVVAATFVDYIRSNTSVASTMQLPGPTNPGTRPAANALTPVRVGRLFVLVVDCSTFTALEARPVLVAARNFVATLQPEDRVGLLAFPVGPALEPTTDRAVIVKALDDITGQKDDERLNQTKLRPSELVIMANCGEGHPDDCGTPSGAVSMNNDLAKAVAPDEPAAAGETQARMGTQNGNRSQFFTEVLASIAKAEFDLAGTADHIRRLLEGMEAVPGRKHIVLVSAGQISNDRGGPRLNTDTLARQLGEWAARANATIDSLFIERNMVSLNTADQRVPPVTMTNLARDRIILERTLDQYADASGGTVFPIMAGAGEYAFKGIALQTSAFYLLGVEAAESDKDGAPHEISVKVTAPGATIRARQWFTMPGSSSSAAPVRDPFAGWNLANATEPMTVDAMVFRGAGADDRAAVALVVDRSAAPDAAAENVEVVAAASSSPTGSPMDQQRTTLRLSWNEATATRDYEVWSRLSLPPGRYDLRIGARMDNTRVGVKTITLDVPDFTNDALSMSGLALFAARRSTVAHADALNGLLLSPPTGRRTFDGADRVRVLVRVYQGRSTTVAPVTVTMHVTDAAGKPVADGETRLEAAAFAPDRSADYETDLPVQDLTPGHYLLTLTATAAGTAVARTLSFMVQ